MKKFHDEEHLDVYQNRYELHQGKEIDIYYQGTQSKETQERYTKINTALSSGYLEDQIANLRNVDYSQLGEENQTLLRNVVKGVTSEVGRSLAGLTFLQLTIKSITPDQCIRLHKGATRKGSFSWVDGISMRTIDSSYITPFLRKHELLNVNKYGIMMTRSLAENYPYSRLYKAEMRGSFNDWIDIVEALESERMNPKLGLSYLISLLRNRSNKFKKMADRACDLVEKAKNANLSQVQALLTDFFNSTDYSARAFEVVIHGLFQALSECNVLGDAKVAPLSQMRSANKKHGNIGDIELMEGNEIVEAWDAKYGKPYLRDELEELRDKLHDHTEVRVAGFVVDSIVDRRLDIEKRVNELAVETCTSIFLLTFSQWVEYEISSLCKSTRETIGYRWLKAVVESFAQRRIEMAPIDEPCETWLKDLINLLSHLDGKT